MLGFRGGKFMFKWFKKKKSTDVLSVLSDLLSLQLFPKYSKLKDSFGALMTNNSAAGYVFGFHDGFVQNTGLYNPSEPEAVLELIENNYKKVFGEQAGYALFSKSISAQDDPDFQHGRIDGGNEIYEYLTNKTPAFGLGRILILNLDVQNNTQEDNPLTIFEKTIEDWPENQAEAALMLLKSVMEGNGFSEKYYGELTVSQIKEVSELLDEIEKKPNRDRKLL